ncbi:hypothetical protein AVEN_263177-1 [Araneus ventricosus]|uniref:Uncharacterized protein n=1 Tax=Araneus ventricosus TaxID=182803 RepID=A0A4Y2U6M3_ARAVE|nr:hypothetical protein AVEN_263177-1 [Araneus ventricosus]
MRACWQNTAGHWYEELLLHGTRGKQAPDEVTPVVTKVLAAVRTLDRFGISDRAGAAVVSAALQDVGIISESNVWNVVDRNKIRRGRTKARTTLLAQVNKDYDHDQFSLYFETTGLYKWKTTEKTS